MSNRKKGSMVGLVKDGYREGLKRAAGSAPPPPSPQEFAMSGMDGTEEKPEVPKGETEEERRKREKKAYMKAYHARRKAKREAAIARGEKVPPLRKKKRSGQRAGGRPKQQKATQRKKSSAAKAPLSGIDPIIERLEGQATTLEVQLDKVRHAIKVLKELSE